MSEMLRSDMRIPDKITYMAIVEGYSRIGTMEECRDAVDRMTKKKPITVINSNGSEDKACPYCDHTVILKTGQMHCHLCGQAIDWEGADVLAEVYGF